MKACYSLVLCGVLALADATPSIAAPETIVGTGISNLSTSGSGSSHGPTWSEDGQSVAFVSVARNLSTNEVQGRYLDVYVRNLISRQTTLVSANRQGIGGGNGHSLSPSVSSNGSVVAFESLASDLAGADNNGVFDIYTRNLTTGETRLISAALDGGSANGPSRSARLSENGRYVVFESSASNLVTNDFNGTNDVFIHDLHTGATSLVSVDSDDAGSANGPSDSAAISADGSVVAFVSRGRNLVAGVTNQSGEAYVRRISRRTTFWAGVSHLVGRHTTPVLAADPALSRDGRFLACKVSPNAMARWDLERPTNTVFNVFPNDGTPPTVGVFLFDDNPRFRALSGPLARLPITLSDDGRYSMAVLDDSPRERAMIQRVDFETFETSVGFLTNGLLGFMTNQFPLAKKWVQAVGTTDWPEQPFQHVTASRDGSRLVFLTDLNGWDTNVAKGAAQIFLADETVALPRVVTTNFMARPGRDLGSTISALSPDGRQIAYETSDVLVPEDLNNLSDVYRRDLDSGVTELISERAGSRPSQVPSGPSHARPNSISADGRWLVFSSMERQAVAYDSRIEHQVWLRDLAQGTNHLLQPSEAWFSRDAVISLDGRHVAWVQREKGGQATTSLVRLDRETGVRTVLPATYPWFSPIAGLPHTPMQNLSPDGRWVALQVSTPSISAFARNLELETNVAINVDYLSRTIAGGMTAPVFSPDSRWLAFSFNQSLGSNQPPGLHLRNLQDGQIQGLAPGYISPIATNSFAFCADSRFIVFARNSSIIRRSLGPDQSERLVMANGQFPNVNGDGRYVVCEAPASGAIRQIVRFDLQTGRTNLISRAQASSRGGNAPSRTPAISADGRFVAFASQASDLVAHDTNGVSDVFVRDTLLGTTLLVSINVKGTGSGDGASMNPVFGADGCTVLFHSFASDLIDGDHNQSRDVYVVRLGAADTDSDGLDDDWEQAYFGWLHRDGTADFDGDGVSDRDEFLAGTAPTADTSILRVITLSSAGGPGTRVLWSAVPGRSYRVEFKSSLDDSHWQSLTDPVTATSETGVAVDSNAAGQSRFYRVVLEP